MSKTVIIDAGHGGADSGASGFGVQEKEWALKISLYQYERLKELGAQVYMTRQSDHSLNHMQRVSKIKDQYDVCLSNHWNAFNGAARGVETIYSVRAQPAFAEDLARRLVSATGLPLRRAFSREIKKGVDYYFMHRLTGRTETVIIEYGFIDNREDHQLYLNEDVFTAAAEAVIEGVCSKVNILYQSPAARVKTAKSVNAADGGDKGSTPVLINQPHSGVCPDTYIGRRLRSVHEGKLRFYSKPSWQDKDVYGYLNKGLGFPVVMEKIPVGRGEQYKVRNSRGQIFYVTASSRFVELI
ncbi:N-acetylmuramoyl-L-alanine amidase [Alkalibacterium sp. AK22]|uniref:N-acetylmuramoyl-L-alanine amidase family protein n=1 Tax=Alkalibacterium sp. AK22 TaxID=1229520 RepID=UPI00044EF1B2|nr:N-acetylmuramoyl-L-alanine amidase [Alkalibacterium sp. AK22]EXJ23351.1 N-acetylmuramoyl-L-alanine amidase [Alkalibacterium sp. AK22]